MSELVLQESTGLDQNTSSDDELNLVTQETNSTPYRRLIGSTDKVDKRLLKQCMISQDQDSIQGVEVLKEDTKDDT